MSSLADLYNLCSNSGIETSSEFWSSSRHGLKLKNLDKFWSELSTQERQKLLRIDKLTLFEQVRRNMYCSKCNGLLLETYLQIVMYVKSLAQEGEKGNLPYIRQGKLKSKTDGNLKLENVCQNDFQDPSAHPWGGLTVTKDGILTVLDCYLYAKTFKELLIVFDIARARERQRELLYPGACGSEGPEWTSQGIHGKGHGPRETCAFHISDLSIDTSVQFWSVLEDETQQSLLKMKEEDFIKSLTYRFDRHRFCKDCRRNVNREIKELKELKHMRKELRCTSWFCVASPAFRCEVSRDSVLADWHRNFVDNIGLYHHFEWAVGTKKGLSNILEFENVGMIGKVQVSGLDLSGLTACYITLRAWKMDGQCSEFSVKAHALKGQQCVHSMLAIDDGFVMINGGEGIRSLLEHDSDAKNEENDDSLDNGHNSNGECYHPQRHAKNPELAREYLLDAASVFFKEQVKKALRMGTMCQNTRSLFVYLAMNLLEDRLHFACKEIVTLEKQTKLLEEEEKEKHEEEERKERKKVKEREKKLRRKERLRVKDKDMNIKKKSSVSSEHPYTSNVFEGDEDEEKDSAISLEKPNIINDLDPVSSKTHEEHALNDSIISETESHSDEGPNGEFADLENNSISYPVDHSETSKRKPKFQKECWSGASQSAVVSETAGVVGKSEPKPHSDGFNAYSQSSNEWNRQSGSNPTKTINNGAKFGGRFHSSTNRMSDKKDFSSCSSSNQHGEYRPKVETHDVSKKYYRVNKFNQMDYTHESSGSGSKSKVVDGNNTSYRDSPCVKQVWERTETQRKCPRSNCDTGVMSQASTFKSEGGASDKSKLSDTVSSDKICHYEKNSKALSKDAVDRDIKICAVTTYNLMSVSSASNNFSSSLSEGDRNTSSSSFANHELSSDSDSEDAKKKLVCSENVSHEYQDPKAKKKTFSKVSKVIFESKTVPEYSPGKGNLSIGRPRNQAHDMKYLPPKVKPYSQYQRKDSLVLPPSIPLPKYQAPLLPKYQAPLPNYQAPLPKYQAPLPKYQAPLPNYQAPLPNYQAPLPNYQAPLPNYQAPLPNYQAPPTATGYYHQSPSTVSSMPFYPQRHHVSPSPVEYGMNQGSNFVQHGIHHQRPTTWRNLSQVPIYQPVVRTNEINSKDQTVTRKTCGARESFGKVSMERTVPVGKNMLNEKYKKSHESNSEFSLFYFGSPVDLPGKYESNSMVPYINGSVQDEHPSSNKKQLMKEYNLFAKNGRFSFF